jgi:hypothetical protein
MTKRGDQLILIAVIPGRARWCACSSAGAFDRHLT